MKEQIAKLLAEAEENRASVRRIGDRYVADGVLKQEEADEANRRGKVVSDSLMAALHAADLLGW